MKWLSSLGYRRINRRSILFAFIALVMCYTGDIFPSVAATTVSCYNQLDPLSCYLEQKVDIQIAPPAFCADLGDNIHFCMTQLDCFGISINQIQSEYLAPTSMMIGTYKVGAECFGHWNLSQIFLHEEGTVDLTVSNIDVDITLQFTKSQLSSFQYLPNATQFSSCATNQNDIDVQADFKGLNVIFDAVVRGALQTFIPTALQELVCVEMANYVETNGTALLNQTIDPYLESLISTPADVPGAFDDAVNWSQSTIVSVVDEIINFINSVLSHSKLRMREFGNTLFYSHMGFGVGEGIIVDVNATIELDFSNFTTIPVVVYVEKIEFEGFNTLSDLVFLSPNTISNSSLDFGAKLQHLQGKFYFSTWLGNSSYHHSYKMLVDMTSIDLKVILDLAIVEMDIENLYIDQLMTKNCFLSTIEQLWVSSIDVVTHKDEAMIGLDVKQLELLSTNITDDDDDVETLEYDLVALVNHTLLLAAAGFEELTSDVVGGILQGPFRSTVNKRIEEMMSNVSDCVEHIDTSGDVDYVEFCNSPLITKIDQIVNDMLGVNGLNLLMLKAGNEATFSVLGVNVTVMGLSSFGIVSILDPYCGPNYDVSLNPERQYTLGNELLLGTCYDGVNSGTTDIQCRPLQIKIDFDITPSSSSSVSSFFWSFSSEISSFLFDGSFWTSEPPSLTLTVQNLYIFLDLFAEYDLNKLKNLQVNELCVSCFIAALDNFKVRNLVVNATSVTESSSNDTSGNDITEKFNMLMSQLGQWGLLDTALTNALYISKEKCAEGPNPNPTEDDDYNDSGLTLNMKIIIVVVSFTAILVFYVLYSHHHLQRDKMKIQKHHDVDISHESIHNADSYADFLRNYRPSSGSTILKDSMVASPLYIPPEVSSTTLSSSKPQQATMTSTSSEVFQAGQMQEECQHEIIIKNNLESNEDKKPSMCYDPRISIYYRVVMPCLCVTCFGLFLWSNNDFGATVNLEMHIGYGVIGPISIFDFGLGDTVQDMWDAEVYLLAILIAFFSGFWPYLKLTVMFLAWTLPVKTFSEETRNIWLIVMDVLGKWSLIDAFVLTLMMVAFFFQIHIGASIEVLVTVYPDLGFYTFLLGTIVSLVIGHVTLNKHRKVVAPLLSVSDQTVAHGKRLSNDGNGEIEIPQLPRDDCVAIEIVNIATMNHLYAVNREIGVYLDREKRNQHIDRSQYYIAITLFGKISMVLLICGNLLLLSLGIVAYTFQFEFKGLTGLLLGNDSIVPYSFYGIGMGLPAASGNASDPAPYVIQFFYFIYGLGVPVTVCVSIIAIWIVPLPYKLQKKALTALEILHAWSALDVFCLSVFAANLEISQFATFIVGDSCDNINKFLSAELDSQLDGDDVCFDLVATLKWDAWMIFAAAFMLFVNTSSFLSILHVVIHDKETLLEALSKKSSRPAHSNRERSSSMTVVRQKVVNEQKIDALLNLESESTIYSSLLTAETTAGIHDSWHTNVTNDSNYIHLKNTNRRAEDIYSGWSINRICMVVNKIFLRLCLFTRMVKLVTLYSPSNAE